MNTNQNPENQDKNLNQSQAEAQVNDQAQTTENSQQAQQAEQQEQAEVQLTQTEQASSEQQAQTVQSEAQVETQAASQESADNSESDADNQYKDEVVTIDTDVDLEKDELQPEVIDSEAESQPEVEESEEPVEEFYKTILDKFLELGCKPESTFEEPQDKFVKEELDQYLLTDSQDDLQDLFDFLTDRLDYLERIHDTYALDSEETKTKLSIIDKVINDEKLRHERINKDLENVDKYAPDKFIKNALKPLYDSFDHAEKNIIKIQKNHESGPSPEIDKLKEIVTEFKDNLTQELIKNNVTIFGEAKDMFDPQEHHAVATYPVSRFAHQGFVENQICFVTAKGFKLYDRVIVPATVIVVVSDEEHAS